MITIAKKVNISTKHIKYCHQSKEGNNKIHIIHIDQLSFTDLHRDKLSVHM